MLKVWPENLRFCKCSSNVSTYFTLGKNGLTGGDSNAGCLLESSGGELKKKPAPGSYLISMERTLACVFVKTPPGDCKCSLV